MVEKLETLVEYLELLRRLKVNKLIDVGIKYYHLYAIL